MGVRARHSERLVDPFDRVGVTVAHPPVLANLRAQREGRFGVVLADRPRKRPVEVVDLGVEPREVSLGALAHDGRLGTVALGQREVEPIVILANGVSVGRRHEALGGVGANRRHAATT